MKPHAEQSPEERAARVRFSRAVGLLAMREIATEDLDAYIAQEMADPGSGVDAAMRVQAARHPGVAKLLPHYAPGAEPRAARKVQ
jgi:hypothetical protein